MKNNKAIKWVIILILTFVILPIVITNLYSSPQYYEASESLTIRKIWELPEVFVNFSEPDTIRLVAVENYFAIAGNLGSSDYANVLCIDKITGKVICKLKNKFILPRDISYLAADQNYLYVAYAGTNKISGTETLGASQVVAYNTTRLEEKWSQPILGSRSILGLFPTNGQLIVDSGSFASHNYVLKDDGQTIKPLLDENGFNLLLATNKINIFYKVKFPNTYTVTANHLYTNEEIWEVILNQHISQATLENDNQKLILKTSQGFAGSIYVIDANTGKMLWNGYDNRVLSNFVTDGNRLIFLDNTFSLLLVDLHSGITVDQLKLTPRNPSDLLYEYSLALDGDILALYLGDSQQLMGFQLSD